MRSNRHTSEQSPEKKDEAVGREVEAESRDDAAVGRGKAARREEQVVDVPSRPEAEAGSRDEAVRRGKAVVVADSAGFVLNVQSLRRNNGMGAVRLVVLGVAARRDCRGFDALKWALRPW